MQETGKNNEVAPAPEHLTDMSEVEMALLESYKHRGRPGLHRVDENLVHRLFSLYLAGKTYDEISHITGTKKETVLFLSDRLLWYKSKIEYLVHLNSHIVAKVSKTRLEAINFLTNLIAFQHKYYGKKFNEYLMTGDEKVAASIDWKPLEKYMRALDSLDKLMGGTGDPDDPKNRRGPIAEIHLTGNAQITSSGPGQLHIKTGAEDPEANVIRALAEFKRAQENKKKEEG
jgi:hypothetical protein